MPPNGWVAFTEINQDAAPSLPSHVNLKLNGTISESVLILQSPVVKWRGCGGKSNYETLAAAEKQKKQTRGGWRGRRPKHWRRLTWFGQSRAAWRYKPFHQPLNARPNLLTFMKIAQRCQTVRTLRPEWAVNSGKTFTNLSEWRGPSEKAALRCGVCAGRWRYKQSNKNSRTKTLKLKCDPVTSQLVHYVAKKGTRTTRSSQKQTLRHRCLCYSKLMSILVSVTSGWIFLSVLWYNSTKKFKMF